jgi:hypothetical protein
VHGRYSSTGDLPTRNSQVPAIRRSAWVAPRRPYPLRNPPTKCTARYGKAAAKAVRRAMRRRKRGALRSGSGKGKVVRSRKQAHHWSFGGTRKRCHSSQEEIRMKPARCARGNAAGHIHLYCFHLLMTATSLAFLLCLTRHNNRTPRILRRWFRRLLLRMHIVFRMWDVHDPFIEPVHNVVETFDPMPWLSRA